MVCYGISSNLGVPLTQKYGAPVVQRQIQLMAVAMIAPFGVYGITQKFDPNTTAVASMLALGALGTGAAFLITAWLMGNVGATRGSIIGYCIPVVAIFLGWSINGDAIVPLHIIGTALVLSGAFLSSRSGR